MPGLGAQPGPAAGGRRGGRGERQLAAVLAPVAHEPLGWRAAAPGDFNTGKAKPAPTFTFSFDGGGGGESSVAAPFKTVFSFGDAAPAAAAVDDVGPAFCSRFVDACSIPLPEEDSAKLSVGLTYETGDPGCTALSGACKIVYRSFEL